VNTYAYDSANRLTSLSGGQTATYAYNGLGDRLTQNGVNYTLDLNAGLTQVLNDGTNQYLYGVGRIAQVNTSTLVTDYFITDALGSVRQLTNGQGEITLANAYEPYGTLAQSAGSAQTSYGFTGEFTDPSGMVYLRARYYASGDGRFISRDTWMGDYNSPLSLNRWNYVQSNPVNYFDPSGNVNCRVSEYDYAGRADFAEQYVARKNVNLLNTYTAAGIGVQCLAPDKPWGDVYQGVGIAQITDKQVEEEYGVPVYHLDKNGEKDECKINSSGKLECVIRGYGLRCWIRIGDGCTICKTRDELASGLLNGQNFDDIYRLEDIHNQAVENDWAVEYMRRRIEQVMNMCLRCTDTDLFIAAALGQNGSGLNPRAMEVLSKSGTNNPYRPNQFDYIDWEKYFEDRIAKGFQERWDTSHQLDLFFNVAWELHRRSPTGWYIPSRLNTTRIKNLASMR
jgi:RHS repeat-associated protein